VNRIEDLINHTENLKVPEGRSKSEIWADLQNKIGDDTVKSKKRFIKHPVFYYSVASTIILFFSVLFFLSYKNTTEIFVQAGQKEKVFLPDGSEVIINSVSSLSFSTKKWESERIVDLEGEAFFNVKKGSRFTVKCSNGTVEVKGTIFNVFSRGDVLEVKCTEGVVSVISKSGKTKHLEQNLGVKFNLDNNIGEIFSLNDSNTDLWTNGQFYFDNVNIENVFKEMERQFDINIQFEGKTTRFFSGYFTNKDLDRALNMVCSPMSLSYEIENESLVVIQ